MPPCEDLSRLKKYRERQSPPYSAAACPGQTKKGNDGKMYTSVPNAKGTYRWAKVAAAPSSANRAAPAPSSSNNGLSAKKVVELKKMAKNRGITGYSKLKKANLIGRLRAAPAPSSSNNGLSAKKVADLKKMAKNRGITGYSKLKKALLIRKLRAASGSAPAANNGIAARLERGGRFNELLKEIPYADMIEVAQETSSEMSEYPVPALVALYEAKNADSIADIVKSTARMFKAMGSRRRNRMPNESDISGVLIEIDNVLIDEPAARAEVNRLWRKYKNAGGKASPWR